MRALTFAGRCTKEIVRDPLSLFFGIAFPIILLLLLSAINSNIPTDIFNIEQLTPGIAVFSLSFIALFAAQTLAKDRSTAYLARLLTTPMTAKDFVLGYTLPLGAIAVVQSMACFITAYALGLSFSVHHFVAFFALLLAAIIFVGIGLLCGTLLSEKAAVGLCGALLTNLTAWLSGAWFDLTLVGGAFETVAYALPFVHAVDMVKAIVIGDYSSVFPHLYVVLAYAIIILSLAIFFFNRKLIQD